MELERTHTQPRDPNTREHVTDNYDNNEQDNNNDNLNNREELCFRIGNCPPKITGTQRKCFVANTGKRKTRAITVILFCIVLFSIG